MSLEFRGWRCVGLFLILGLVLLGLVLAAVDELKAARWDGFCDGWDAAVRYHARGKK